MTTDSSLSMAIFKLLSTAVLVLLTLNPNTANSESTGQCVVMDSSKLYLLVLGPFPDPNANPGPGWDAAPALIPAARLAVKQINSRSDILVDYQLELLEGDSGCNLEDRAFVSFIDNIFYSCQGTTIAGIIGPGCSAATLALAPLTVRDEFNIIQLSITTTPLINGTQMEHHNTFRTVTSSLKYIDAFEEIIMRQKWNRVAALYDDLSEFHIATYNEFRNRINKLNSQDFVFHFAGINDQVLSGALSGLVRARVRVIFVFAGQGVARQVLCAAFHSEIRFPSYQFFFTDRVVEDFNTSNVPVFRFGAKSISCTTKEMSQALNGTILSINQFERQDQNSSDTAAGISYKEYKEQYYEELDNYLEEINLNRTDFAVTAFNYFNAYYDATWALALSLNSSIEELASKGYNLSYHYRYNMPSTKEVGDVVRSNLVGLEFNGMSGRIMFDEDRHEVSSIDIDLYQIGYNDTSNTTHQCKVGVFDGKKLSISSDTELIKDEFEAVLVLVPLGVNIFFVALVVIVTIITILLQIAIVYYANHRSVKASSPHLNHLIFSGCYLCLLAIIIFLSQEAFASNLATNHLVFYGVSCSMSFWTTSFSFSLIFGTVVGKTWRIYRIFTHFSKERVKYVSDEFLIAFVLVLIFIDTVMLSIWNSVNPWYLFERSEINNDQMLLTRYTCTCDNLIVWAAVMLGLKGLVAAIAVYLSILTIKVHRKEYKMTKNISIFIYSLILIYSLGIIIVIFTTSEVPVLSFIVINLMFIATVVLTCACLILPSLLPVQNFWGSKILAKSNSLKRTLSETLNPPRPSNSNGPNVRNRKQLSANQSPSISLSPLM